jgi:murein DD-endopeptidase MepM/ murein hydrolase activator NlpD
MLGLAAGMLAAIGGPSAAVGATSSAGGVVAPGKPKVNDVHCLTRCVSGRTATPGAQVIVKGGALDYVRKVVFRGPDGPLGVRPTETGSARVRTVVPDGAVSSRPYVVDFRGRRSNRSPVRLGVMPASAIPREIFPVRGPHSYGSAGARFGAGRSGHSHQGQDVMAACGTRLVSAVPGRVEYRAYQGSAGNYVVIDSKGSNVDLVYMHLARPAAVRPGQQVGAGRQIGVVGATGNAQGCHLHFEYWVGDWYGGGHPVDPYRYLKAWDAKS